MILELVEPQGPQMLTTHFSVLSWCHNDIESNFSPH